MSQSPATAAPESALPWSLQPYQSHLLPAAPPAESTEPPPSPPEAPTLERSPNVTSSPVWSDATKRGLSLLGVALCSGICGDLLLRATPWGLNLFVWMSLTVLAAALWQRQQRVALDRTVIGLMACLLFFSAAFAWRASPVLRGLDMLARAALLLAIGLRSRTGKLLVADLTDYGRAALRTIGNASGGLLVVLTREIHWQELPREGWSRRAAAVARGLLLAAPLLLVFGGLLMAADAVFEELIASLFRFDLLKVCLHLLTIVTVTWLVGGYLRSLQPAEPAAQSNSKQTSFPRLGLVEMSIALGLLDLLFLLFVAVQFQYLFFGAAHFKPGASMAYSMYARRGFFELVIVAALVLPLLLGSHALLPKNDVRAERTFRFLAGGQIALLFVIMASAMYRMRLYQLCCGLTELRVYTMAFMGWLSLVFSWFGWTVLRGRRERFAFGALAAGLVLVACLHVINPDAMIVRVNVQRARTGQPFDADYTSSLSADSIPELVAGLPRLSENDRALVRQRVLERREEFAGSGWRTWNWSRMRAWQASQTIQTITR